MTEERSPRAASDETRLETLERRVTGLEERLARLERGNRTAPQAGAVGRPHAPTPVPAPSYWGQPARAARPNPATPVAQPGPQRWVGPPRPRLSLAELEERVTGRLLAWLGGFALIAGVAFFLSLAFTRGWIAPPGRVSIGIVAGAAGMAVGGWLLRRQPGVVALVLVATGLGAVSLALFAATRLYALLPAETGVGASLVSALAAAVIAVRTDAQQVAAFGLVAVLAAPPLLGAPPTALTLALVAAALVGTTLLALRKVWPWLPPLAFILAAPQLLSWVLSERTPLPGLLAGTAFWLLNAVAAAGEELQNRRAILRRTSGTLLVLNAAFWVLCGFVLLSGEHDWLRAPFLVLVGAAHFALGGVFLIRGGERHLFGLVAAGLGVASLTVAVPVQFGGPVVPVAWAAEAVALAWIYDRRRHDYSGVASLVLAALAVGYFVFLTYPLGSPVELAPGHLPFANEGGLTLVFLVAVLIVSAVLVLRQPVASRAAMLAAVVLVAWAVRFELEPAPAVVAWSLLAIAAVVVERELVTSAAIVRRLRPEPVTNQEGAGRQDHLYLRAGALLLTPGTVVGGALIAFAAQAAFTLVAPPDRLFVDAETTTGQVPLANWSSAALATTAAAVMTLTRERELARVRSHLVLVAGLVVLYLLSVTTVDAFQAQVGGGVPWEELAKQAQLTLSVLWAVLGAAALGIGLVRDVSPLRQAGIVLLGLATVKVFVFDLAALDVAYRVLSLIILGLLLLASAYLYQRLRPRLR